MDDYLKKQTLENISKSQSILIAVSKNAHFDGLASALALYLSFKKINKSANVIASQPTVGDAQYLYAVDKVGSDSNSKDVQITIDNAVKNVDKVTYFLDGDKLKIIVHTLAESTGISQKEITIGQKSQNPDLVIAIGYESAEQLNQDITREYKIGSNVFIINISNREMSQKYAQVNLVDTNTGSISEITASLLQVLSLPINEDIAFNLYSGIKVATNMFSPSIAKPSSFSAAQFLVKFGAGKASLADSLISQTDKSPQAGISPQPYQPIARDINPSIQFRNPPEDQKNGDVPSHPLYTDEQQTPIEQVELEPKAKESWLKPPKVYKGSKSFDRES